MSYYEKLSSLLFGNVNKTPEDIEKMFPQRELPQGAVVSRSAPSPTGFVHLGNYIQMLTSDRLCKQSGGVLFLRIEDTDAKREVAGAVETLLETVSHYDINFDEGVTATGETGAYGPYRQRARKDIYHVFAKVLVEQGLAYPCFCTEEELAEIHTLQEAEKANFGYFGKWAKWRDRPIEEIEEKLKSGAPWVLRFRSTGNIENKFKFTDLIKGELELTENDIDYVLLKSDGIPVYAFAHVVDDHLMKTTHVVRGDEWIATLPFHLQLFRALGFKPPKYLHIGPLMIMDGESKRKLSKSKDPQAALTFYIAKGYTVAAVKDYIMTILNSNFEDWRRANPDASIDEFKFSTKKMNPAGSLFDEMKLNDISKNVIAKLEASQVVDLLIEWAKDNDPQFYSLLSDNKEHATAIFAIGRGGKKPRKDIAKWDEAKDYCSYFYDDLFKFEQEYPSNISTQDIKDILEAFISVYNESDDNQVWFDKVKQVSESLGFTSDMKVYKQNPTNFKGSVAEVSTVIRVAITGRTNTPDLCSIMKLLGTKRCVQRMQAAIKKLN